MPVQLSIDSDSTVPALRQIADHLRLLLVEGKLASGAELPSVRRLGIELGVHFNTVAEAYRQLAAEGWLELKQGRGARVIERHTPAADEGTLLTWRSQLKQLTAQMLAQGLSKMQIAGELQGIAEELTSHD